MRLSSPAILLFILSLSGCGESPTITQGDNSMYGPRWIDYDGWGKLELGMSKNDVLQTMGEPYMTEQASIAGPNKSEVLIFKVRVKSYVLRNELRGIVTKQGATEKLVTTEVKIEQDRKPEKFADTNVWGQFFNLYCTIENDKLVHWICPELIPQPNDTSKTNKHLE